MEEVKLLYVWASPYSIRVILALELKGIKYQRIEEDVKNKSKLLIDSNPLHKKVPVLIHNGRPVVESKVIIDYIDEVWPEKHPILPRGDPFARAEQRFWADFVQNKIFAVANDFVFRKGGKIVQEEFIGNCSILERELGRRSSIASSRFFAGDEIGLVDIVLVSTALCYESLVEVGGLAFPSESECPLFRRLLQEIRQHPVVSSSLPDPLKLKDFLAISLPWLRTLSGSAS